MSSNNLGRTSADASIEGPESIQPDPFDLLWRFFSSTKLALVLILVIAALCLVSVMITQAPGGLLVGSADYQTWLQRVRPRYGFMTDVLSALGLFSAASSLWMRALLGLLAINTLVCTLNRWPRVWRTVFHPTVSADKAVFANATHRRELEIDESSAAETIDSYRGVFAKRGYRSLVESGESTYLYADRNRFGRLGTIATHLAIILFLIGAVVTSLLGVRDSEFVVPEGSTRAVGFGTTLAVKAESFADEYYPDGPPKDYRSDLILYDNGKEVARQTIRVNEPLVYNGIRFHQSFFGPAVVMQVKNESGAVIFEDGVGLPYSMGDGPLGYFDLTNQKLVAAVIGPSSSRRGDSTLAAGQVRIVLLKDGGRVEAGSETLTLGQPKVIAGLTYTFVRDRQFTGLQVVRDPGAPIIWFASALMVVGMIAVFYFPHRRFWLRLQPGSNRRALVSVVGVAGRDPGFVDEFALIAAELIRTGPPPASDRTTRTGMSTAGKL